MTNVRGLSVLRIVFIAIWCLAITMNVSAQNTTCETLHTEYSIRSSNWYWVDNDTVVFEVWNGAQPNGLSTTLSITAWYEYNFANQVLQEIPNNPLNALRYSALHIWCKYTRNSWSRSYKDIYELES